MAAEFRWNDWNLNHATGHGVSVEEAESVVRNARAPWPESVGDGKYRVYGPGRSGRTVHAIFIKDDDGILYVIHARPVVRSTEKRRVNRRRK